MIILIFNSINLGINLLLVKIGPFLLLESSYSGGGSCLPNAVDSSNAFWNFSAGPPVVNESKRVISFYCFAEFL